MITIWKLPAKHGPFTLELRRQARVLSVQARRDGPMIWIELDTTRERVSCRFQGVHTGEPIPESGVYLGTALLDDGDLHVFSTDELGTGFLARAPRWW